MKFVYSKLDSFEFTSNFLILIYFLEGSSNEQKCRFVPTGISLTFFYKERPSFIKISPSSNFFPIVNLPVPIIGKCSETVLAVVLLLVNTIFVLLITCLKLSNIVHVVNVQGNKYRLPNPS